MAGRPRKIDPDKALKAAMKTFWRKGYDGTSMVDLEKATGMQKPTLYATFGDKLSLYKECLNYYAKVKGAPNGMRLMGSEKRPVDAMRDFLSGIMDNAFSEQSSEGCLLVNTVVEGDVGRPELKEIGQAFHEKRRKFVKSYFLKIKEEGKISRSADLEALSEFYATKTLTIPVMAKAGLGQPTIKQFIDTSLQILK